MSTVVYRMYDANCVLLYVGKTCRMTARISGHQSRAEFFGEVDTITVEHFATNAEAMAAERQAIIAESPKYNVQNNLGRGARINRYEGWNPPADGLRINPAFLDLALEHRGDVTIDPTLEELLRSGGGVTLEVATDLARFLGFSVESLFPNAGPFFTFDDGAFKFKRAA